MIRLLHPMVMCLCAYIAPDIIYVQCVYVFVCMHFPMPVNQGECVFMCMHTCKLKVLSICLQASAMDVDVYTRKKGIKTNMSDAKL